jgi:Tol biopolymer transport system component/DNA-binding winged helix-turn-helix (wHTH) protein
MRHSATPIPSMADVVASFDTGLDSSKIDRSVEDEYARGFREPMTSSVNSGSASSSATPNAYAFGEFRLDTVAGKLWRGETSVGLPSRAFDTLTYLIDHRHRIVSKSEIISAIWHDVAVTDDSLVHVVSVLRRELRDDRHNPRYIKTIPRRGYRFVAAAASSGTAYCTASAEVRDTSPIVRERRDGARHRATTASVWLCGALGIMVLALVLTIIQTDDPESSAPDNHSSTIRFSQSSPPGTSIVSGGALSPDARYLAFVARNDTNGGTALWIRAFASGELRQLTGTEGASKPFWAPDGRRIAFFANGKLRATSLSAEQPQTIAPVNLTPAGGSWGPDDMILFAEWASGIYAVPASGKDPVSSVLRLDHSAKDIAITWPQILPDGRHFLYHRVNLDPSRTGTYVGDLVSRDTYRLLDSESPTVYAPTGDLLHVRDDMLIAEELDSNRLELTGNARIIARGVSAPSLDADDMVSAAGNLLTFQSGARHQNLSWINRAGEPVLGLTMPTVIYNPRLSPDQSQLLATGSITADPGLWLASVNHEEFARLETDAIAPLWASDGRSIAFTSRGGFDLIVRPMDGRVGRRRLLSDPTVKILNDWSPSGEEIVYTRVDAETGLDLWTTHVDTGAAEPLLATPFNEMQARISPDGRWIAYASDESGVLEVYVQRYPMTGDRRIVSTNGGGQPQWRADQQELFYLSADRTIMSVNIDSGSAGMSLDAPRQLFPAPLLGDAEDARDHYVVSTDGTRFLVDGSVDQGRDRKITIMVNWATGTREAAPNPTTISEPIAQPL